MTMSTHLASSKLKNVMNLKLTIGQICAGIAFLLPTTVGMITYVNNTFYTKAEAAADSLTLTTRMNRLESAQVEYSKVQTQVYGEVKEISGMIRLMVNEKQSKR